MAEPFDPYHRWLGIPPEDQPPNHYRLLGIALFEDQPDVIEHAADRQMAHLRTFQVGPHAALSQRLLNEVAAAKVCLLKPDKKAAYDGFLRRRVKESAQPAGETAAGNSPPPFPVAPPEEEPPTVELDVRAEEAGSVESEKEPAVAATHARWWPALAAAVLAVGLVAGIAALIVMLAAPRSESPPANSAEPAVVLDVPEKPKKPEPGPTVAAPVPAAETPVTEDDLAFWQWLGEGAWEGPEEKTASASPPQDPTKAKAPPASQSAKGEPGQPPSSSAGTMAANSSPAPNPASAPLGPTPPMPILPISEAPARRPELKPEPFRTVPQIDPLLTEAWTLIRRGEHVKGRDRLVQATKISRDDLRVAFSLGLVDALVTLDWPAAEKQFAQCVQEYPKHVASLNNLALVRLRLGREGLVVKPWQTILAEGPPPPEVVQNLGRVCYLAQKERLSFKPVTQKNLERLYHDAQLTGSSKYDPGVGFRYMGLYGGGNPDFGYLDVRDYEDRWCPVCNAHGKMKCPRRDCSRGMVTRMASKYVGVNPTTNTPIYQSGPIRIRCPTCGGSGWVKCQHCRDGKDKELFGIPGETPAMNPNGPQRERFGVTADGVPVDRYTLHNDGVTVRLITCGAAVTELWVPDRVGRAADVVLGFDELGPYEDPAKNPYFGATVGRVAFRITGGHFTLDGKSHQLTLNTPPHHLHGGDRGFSRMVWNAEAVTAAGSPGVRFTLVSPDGDQGYPGTLKVTVVYTLAPKGELRIDYAATTDRATPVNLTHHGYFNLAGAGTGDVLGHALELATSHYTPLDEKKIPTGQVAPVEGTPFDFRRPTEIGNRMKTDPEVADGYDLSYPLDGADGSLRRAATLSESASGRTMEVWTTEPAIVLYTGNYLDGTVRGKGGAIYRKHAGVCLETAHLPDSVNQPKFPSIILRPDQTYRQTCVYRFSAR